MERLIRLIIDNNISAAVELAKEQVDVSAMKLALNSLQVGRLVFTHMLKILFLIGLCSLSVMSVIMITAFGYGEDALIKFNSIPLIVSFAIALISILGLIFLNGEAQWLKYSGFAERIEAIKARSAASTRRSRAKDDSQFSKEELVQLVDALVAKRLEKQSRVPSDKAGSRRPLYKNGVNDHGSSAPEAFSSSTKRG